MALAESGVYVLNSFLMVVTFTLVRVVFGSCAHLTKGYLRKMPCVCVSLEGKNIFFACSTIVRLSGASTVALDIVYLLLKVM